MAGHKRIDWSNVFLLLLSLVALGVMIYMIVLAYRQKGGQEGYWSLPYAGGDVIVDSDVEQHKIEGPMGRAMDRIDSDQGYPL